MCDVAVYWMMVSFHYLNKAFHLVFPTQVYKSDIALLCLLHIPFSAVHVGTPDQGGSC